MSEHDRENALAVKHMPHVARLASRMCATLPRVVRREDLVSAGYVGLVQASRSFDPAVGVRFMTYASRRVRGAMLDWLRAADWFPVGVRARLKERGQVIPGMYSLEDRLDFALDDGGYDEQSCLISHDAPPERDVDNADFWERPGSGIVGRDLRILQMYYRDGMTARLVGAIVGCTESNIIRILADLRLRVAC